jgi:hypothetical protein
MESLACQLKQDMRYCYDKEELRQTAEYKERDGLEFSDAEYPRLLLLKWTYEQGVLE